MANDRLTALDSSFLHLEDNQPSHMHVASVTIFEGPAPDYQEFVDGIAARLHLVPRYRQKLAFIPFGQGRPKWVDDPTFNISYHVRATALPPPGGEEQLRTLAGRVFAQRLDRDKPLWEVWLVEGLDDNRFALLSKVHHALVDGVSGADLMTVLFDVGREPAVPPESTEKWQPRPLPSSSQLLGEALLERSTEPTEIARSVRAAFRGPRQFLRNGLEAAGGLTALARGTLRPAPASPYNGSIGPHRRFTWVRVRLGDVKAIKDSLGGTVNDVVLATVTGAVRRHLHSRGVSTQDLTLRAMVPVSVRSDLEQGALGNRVAAMMAPLPVWCENPTVRLDVVSDAMRNLKSSGQAVGAEVLTRIGGFAPPTIMAQATRIGARQRAFNLVVTNVPGPQFPLYVQGHELLDVFPMVPLAPNQRLGIALMSYNGAINFGLIGDYDSMPDLEDFARRLAESLEELAEAADVTLTTVGIGPAATTARTTTHALQGQGSSS
ncbi:MAG TPA: wax ester/triacylglycerol synthase family O-acyltransferase [Thermoleophilaceae bacterium]|nr:wax ester/triacylglycerol synthase family O-acyltransferase [Thermoleophilaceae bacterium]